MPVSQKSKSLKKSKKSTKNNRSKKTNKNMNMKKMRGGASQAYIIIINKNTNRSEVKNALDYQANALEENIINDAVDGPHRYKKVEHSYRDGTIKFSIIKTNTRIVDFPQLDFDDEKSLYSFIRSDGSDTYISQNRNTLLKLIEN